MTDAEISAAWDAQARTLADACRATGADQPEMTAVCLDWIQCWIPSSLEPLRCLEIGCGIGRLTFPMARSMPRATVLGLDASPKMLEYARAARGDANVRFMQSCGPGAYGFGQDLYDAAWSVLTFQHLAPERAKEYVVAVGRALRQGGRFVFQFVEGEERQPLSNHFPLDEVCGWLGESRLRPIDSARGVGHELWTWIAAERE